MNEKPDSDYGVFKRWQLETREAGYVVSRAFFASKEEAEREAQRSLDSHIGMIRAYAITEQEIRV